MAVVPSGTRAITASKDGDLRVWDLAEGQCQHVLQGALLPVQAACCAPMACRGHSRRACQQAVLLVTGSGSR